MRFLYIGRELSGQTVYVYFQSRFASTWTYSARLAVCKAPYGVFQRVNLQGF